MTMEITLKLITLFGIVNNIDAYGSGAPASVCQDMTPQHGASAQTGAVPYQISVEPSTYMSGSMNTVTLRSTQSSPFRGYFIQMRRTDNQAIVGGFSLLGGGKLVQCDNRNNAAVTHTENGDKTLISFNWTAPAQNVGQIRIVATVVQVQATFWRGVESAMVTSAGGSQPSMTTERTQEMTTVENGGNQTNVQDVTTIMASATTRSTMSSNSAPIQTFSFGVLIGLILINKCIINH